MTTLADLELERHHSEVHLSRLYPLDRATLMGVFLGIAVALYGGSLFGFAPGGWAWSIVLAVALMAVFLLPLPPDPLRPAAPYLIFLLWALATLTWSPDFIEGTQVLAQYLSVAAIYIVTWRAAEASPNLIVKLRLWALLAIPASLFVFIRAMGDEVSRFGWIRGGNVARPMVMAIALLYLLATVGRSRRFAVGLGGVVLLIAIASGGRMGTFVVALLILLNPALHLSWRMRAALFGAGLALFGLALQFEPVQERLFVGREEGTLEDVVALENNFNTAGRSNNWPRILEACIPEATFGRGIGATRSLTLEATRGKTAHPHNEFIRVLCDTGLVGEALFWGFFLLSGIRGIALFRATGNQIGVLAMLSVISLLLFSVTDNATVYTSAFMAPLALILGYTDWAAYRSPGTRRVV